LANRAGFAADEDEGGVDGVSQPVEGALQVGLVDLDEGEAVCKISRRLVHLDQRLGSEPLEDSLLETF
jgi:hypothetical protein